MTNETESQEENKPKSLASTLFGIFKGIMKAVKFVLSFATYSGK